MEVILILILAFLLRGVFQLFAKFFAFTMLFVIVAFLVHGLSWLIGLFR